MPTVRTSRVGTEIDVTPGEVAAKAAQLPAAIIANLAGYAQPSSVLATAVLGHLFAAEVAEHNAQGVWIHSVTAAEQVTSVIKRATEKLAADGRIVKYGRKVARPVRTGSGWTMRAENTADFATVENDAAWRAAAEADDQARAAGTEAGEAIADRLIQASQHSPAGVINPRSVTATHLTLHLTHAQAELIARLLEAEANR